MVSTILTMVNYDYKWLTVLTLTMVIAMIINGLLTITMVNYDYKWLITYNYGY